MRGIKVLAGLTAIVTLSLISLGGVVHNTDSSLACPDWPLCFGQVFPKMEGSVAIEHSHRLLATLVGFLCVLLVFLCAKRRHLAPRLFKLSYWALALVIFQGVLGGITVLLQISPLISTLHLGTSQIFFAVVAALFWESLKVDAALDFSSPTSEEVWFKRRRFLRITALLLYLQILLGASIRHGGAGVVCGVGPEASLLCLDAATAEPVFWPQTFMAQAHMLHRYLALVVTFFVGLATMPLIIRHKSPKEPLIFRLLAIAGFALVLVQVLLGILTISTGIGLVSVTLHLVCAALLWFVICSLNYLATMMILNKAGKPEAKFSELKNA